MRILVLNGGSSSLKAVLRDLPAGDLPDLAPPPLWKADVDWGRHPGRARIRVQPAGAPVRDEEVPIASPAEVLTPLLEPLRAQSIDAVGHRVVHGGKAMRETTRVTAEVRDAIRRYCEFAPEHNRLELEAIQLSEQVFGPDVPQVAVFDTAFHATLPVAATVYPGPYDWYEQGIRRYGFHGISHRYASARAASLLGRDRIKLISCHLGNGASLAAVDAGRCVDTTMGFTPLEGLMMGTRSGSVDPGILIYLVRHLDYRADQLDHLLNQQSGLLGISGLSADMREILAAVDSGHERARLAYDVYIHRIVREAGGMLASLGGLDALLFTAGVGENSARVRADVCARLRFLGVRLDPERNAAIAGDGEISLPESPVRVLVIRADEDWQVARECHRLMLR